jgi:exodeoxyribonuclease VII small subunit
MAAKKFNFGKAYSELETLVADLEGREIDLDADLPKFDRGMKLAKELLAKMSEAENKVEEISLKYGENL